MIYVDIYKVKNYRYEVTNCRIKIYKIYTHIIRKCENYKKNH